ncbi:MAG: IPT/TIG domain-containing protein, partial [Deltaproteobacteria bacterium]|nr:IPT/TIG domain-containing protein [Deltaproteobacteria bacterium]
EPKKASGQIDIRAQAFLRGEIGYAAKLCAEQVGCVVDLAAYTQAFGEKLWPFYTNSIGIKGIGTCPSTCGNGKQDGEETDVDCGGACAQLESGRCKVGQGCSQTFDCAGKDVSCNPQTKKCADLGCGDGQKGKQESDVDCGGWCSKKCKVDQTCWRDQDCSDPLKPTGNFCQPGSGGSSFGKCAKAESMCGNGKLDAEHETDVDCGGSCSVALGRAKAACPIGAGCRLWFDCQQATGGGGTCIGGREFHGGGDGQDKFLLTSPPWPLTAEGPLSRGICMPIPPAQEPGAPPVCDTVDLKGAPVLLGGKDPVVFGPGMPVPKETWPPPKPSWPPSGASFAHALVSCGGPCAAIAPPPGKMGGCVLSLLPITYGPASPVNLYARCGAQAFTCPISSEPICGKTGPVDVFQLNTWANWPLGKVNCGCSADLQCDSQKCENGSCVGNHCVDKQWNGDETDVDCGGSCKTKCGLGSKCSKGTDCEGGPGFAVSLSCGAAGTCQPTCNDGYQSASETDVDCGGSKCAARCGVGQKCLANADCGKGHVCLDQGKGLRCSDLCLDGKQSVVETGLDCGGPCPKCLGEPCKSGGDCKSAICNAKANKCVATYCEDGKWQNNEVGIDCAGTCPSLCAAGKTCMEDANCLQDLYCKPGPGSPDSPGKGWCTGPTCDDGAQNGSESSIDCGGKKCPGCPTGKACKSHADCLGGACSPTGKCLDTCKNLKQDGNETFIDCGGGSCKPCSQGLACKVGSDCLTGVCLGGKCATDSMANCQDGKLSPGEVDVDCGHTCWVKCAVGKKCQYAIDCQSGICGAGKTCVASLCDDGKQNGDESDVDCGGSACKQCLQGGKCFGDGDCKTSACSAGKCAASKCSNGVHDGGETDVDCGGPCAQKCGLAKGCGNLADCQAGLYCNGKVCVASTCEDKVQNFGESDVDCGGPCTTKCSTSKKCTAGGDCASGICSAKLVCATTTCDDGSKNGSETDMDCGGTCAAKCAIGQACKSGSDCAGGVCSTAKCAGTAPKLTSLGASSGVAGSSLTLAGENFSAEASENSVLFGTTQAQVTAASATALTVTVPAVTSNAAPYDVKVTINAKVSASLPFTVLPRITTIAGGDAGFGGDNGPAQAAKLKAPVGVAVNATGHLAIGDGGNGRIRFVPSKDGDYFGMPMQAGTVHTVAGGGTGGSAVVGTAASLKDIRSLYLTDAGDIAIADAAAQGGDTAWLLSSVTGSNYGLSMKAGFLYALVGPAFHGTWEWTKTSYPSAKPPSCFLAAAVPHPSGLLLVDTCNGDLYQTGADFDNGTVMFAGLSSGTVFGEAVTTGNVKLVEGNGKKGQNGGILFPTSVAVANAQASGGDLYVTDQTLDVVMFRPGKAGSYFGQSMQANMHYWIMNETELFNPWGVAVTNLGLYVLDTANQRVAFRPTVDGYYYGQSMSAAKVYTVSGTKKQAGFAGDGGSALQAQLSNPMGFAVDAQGRIFIADTGNHRIRRVDP